MLALESWAPLPAAQKHKRNQPRLKQVDGVLKDDDTFVHSEQPGAPLRPVFSGPLTQPVRDYWALGGIGTGDPPIPVALGGMGTGDPPIPVAFGGIGTGEPPIPATLRRRLMLVSTTSSASINAKR
jgi:hypothetical protein